MSCTQANHPDCGSLVGLFLPRVRRAGQSVVFVLLAWTALDVLNPALCGLDELPFVAASVALDTDTTTPVESPASEEDCFSCSHNVNICAIVQVSVSLHTKAQVPAHLAQNAF